MPQIIIPRRSHRVLLQKSAWLMLEGRIAELIQVVRLNLLHNRLKVK